MDGIVGAHDGIGAAIDDGGAEGGSVGVVEIVERNGNIEAVAEELRAAMNGIVFGSGDGFEVVGIVALKTGDEGDAETSGEEGILAVSFLAASPAGIAKDVDIGRPEGEAEEATSVVVELGIVIFGAGFGGNGVGNTMEEVGVPCSGEADGLREDGGGAGKGDAVKTFVPPVVGGDLQARDGGSNVLHLGDFFVGGEAGDEVVDALVGREGRIEVGRRGGLGESENRDGEECEEDKGQGFHAGIVAQEEGARQGGKKKWRVAREEKIEDGK